VPVLEKLYCDAAAPNAGRHLLGTLNDPPSGYERALTARRAALFGRSDLDGSSPLENLTILLIEDDESMRILVGRMLSRLKMKIIAA
jgi:hypothetical protein